MAISQKRGLVLSIGQDNQTSVVVVLQLAACTRKYLFRESIDDR